MKIRGGKEVMPMKDLKYDAEKKWNEFYSHGKLSDRDKAPSPFIEQKIDFIKWLKVKEILDLGCGYGRNLVVLTKRGFNVSGVDISEKAITLCREYLESLQLTSQNIYRADAYNLKEIFENNTFDMIISTALFLHLSNPDIVVEEIWQILKKNGYALIELHSTEDPSATLGKQIGPKTYIQRGILFRVYDFHDIIKLFSKKFEILSIDKVKYTEHPHPGFRELPHQHISWIVFARKRDL